MEKNQYDLTVAYRIYPGITKTVPIYQDDKLTFSELCLKTFKKALGTLKVKIWVLLDNCGAEYDALVSQIFR